MNSFFLDASALVKRFALEPGSSLLDQLFVRIKPERLACLMLGAAEVVAALVRKRNSGHISAAVFAASMLRLRLEVLDAKDFPKLACDNPLIDASLPLLSKHAINSTDGVVLQATLSVAAQARALANDYVLVASDQRLLKAAQAEGLLTFDPETQDQAALSPLLGP